ncbi:MAG TPA: DUF790 family protein, partial [Labilithrix sp.]|nr:DUF790 family protein [Labilithrix sp.]
MLPTHLVLVTSREGRPGRGVPRYLTARDEIWIRAVIDLFDGYVGRTVRTREEDGPGRARTIAREHGVPPLVADGVVHVLTRRFRTELDTALDPARVRAVTFEAAARAVPWERDVILARAAEQLCASRAEVEHALFADRPCRRRIVAPSSPLLAAEIVDAYNLALVQGLLLRSEWVTIEVREHVRAVVRFAKLAGLLCTCATGDRGTRLDVSGPLAILRHTTKYGFALASFFPAVVATTAFRLEARCIFREEPTRVHIDANDRIARTHKLPKDADSVVERALARDVRRLGSAWTLVREAHAITVGSRV